MRPAVFQLAPVGLLKYRDVSMPKDRSESRLVARCLKGDAEAWDEFFNLHYAPTGRFIFQLSHDISRDEADDLCQDVFLAAIRNLSNFKGQCQLRTWLFRIAANKVRDHRDKRRAGKRGGGMTDLSLDQEDPVTGLTLDPPSPLPAPDEQMNQSDRAVLLHHALDRLGEPCREVIELRYFGELSYEEIAASLQMNPKTVSSRLSKCLAKLQSIAGKLFSREKTTEKSV